MTEKEEPPKCWAHSLSECSQKISREHLFSASLFPNAKSVNVSGFPWCKGETKNVGLASMTAKILCSKHNSLLSPLDAAAGNAFKVFDDIAILIQSRALEGSSKFKVRHFRINGILLERWLLKTLVNLCRNSEFLIGAEATVPGMPDENLVRICYGLKRFEGKSGMYLAAQLGAKISSGPEIEFAPLIYDGAYIAGGFFKFRGFFMFLSLFEERLPPNFDWMSNTNGLSGWAETEPTWHFKKIVFKLNQVRSSVVHFAW